MGTISKSLRAAAAVEQHIDRSAIGRSESAKGKQLMYSEVAAPIGSQTAEAELPLFRRYTLRLCYLILAVGLGVYMWPSVIHHSTEFAITSGIQISLLAGLGATAALGLRYPVQMLPVLLFELIWKTIYLIAFAWPLWSAHQISPAAAEDIKACLMVVIFVPLIPWRYVFARYVAKPGERWR